ncbi:MAG TPA: hypothetical protein VFL14_07985 [Xanthomonadales bacterium]|nr:hypothetical protein [Xanthomonadales bacterium]
MSTRWPGFGPAATIVVPVDPATWAPPAAAVTIAGVRFAPKRELHVTVVGKALGARVRDALDEAHVAALFEALDWRFRRTHRIVHVRREVDGVVEQSLIERVEQPAMATFHDVLAQRLGTALPVPPPHVTLWTHGTDEGIGLPDEETLARWNVGEIVLP